ncbi:hypothetical protein PFISCL1PPCAC_29062, partial [Pristionchus fissidentatus]
VVAKYREYGDGEICLFFLAMAILGCCSMIIFAFLPNKQVSIQNIKTILLLSSNNFSLHIMMRVLVHRRILILTPFYLYIGLFFSFWISIVPTTLQFTKALAAHRFLPAYFGMSFSVGSTIMSMTTMFVSTRVKNFSFKPLACINFLVHATIYCLVISVIPKWSTVRPNDEPSLFIQPSVLPILLLGFLFGLADAANNTTRTVISSLLIPSHRQQTFGASRFYHALAASILFFASPSLNVYTYVAVLSVVLV